MLLSCLLGFLFFLGFRCRDSLAGAAFAATFALATGFALASVALAGGAGHGRHGELASAKHSVDKRTDSSS